MADQLYLSYWLRDFDERSMLRYFEKLLRTFPFSATAPVVSTFRIHAVQQLEPPLLELAYDGPPDVEAIIQAAAESQNADCAYLVEGCWDLWQYEKDWQLHPTGVLLACYGPLFQNDLGDQLRIELGFDSYFLPQRKHPASAGKTQSNIQSLLRLARELDDALPVKKRALWTESGEDFAGRLQSALGG